MTKASHIAIVVQLVESWNPAFVVEKTKDLGVGVRGKEKKTRKESEWV